MLDRLRAAVARRIAPLAMKAADGVRLMGSRLQAAWTDITFSNLVKHGYKSNAAVWACVRVWATAFPEPEMRVRRRTETGREWLPEHPASLLIASPNPWMGEDMFWQYVITYMAIGGNCYVWKERSRSGAVIGLWPMHDGTMAPVPDPEGWLSHYRYDLADGTTPQLIPPGDIVHLVWAPDPSNPIRGIGPLVAAARAVDMGSEAARYVYAYLKNDASPRTVLSLKEPIGTMKEDLKRRFTESYGGDNRGGVIVVDEGEASISRLGANLSELAVESLWNMPEAWISAAFEVPAIKAGLSVGLQRGYSGANADALNSDFAQTRLAPRWRMVAGQFTRALLSEIDPDPSLSFEFDTSTVQALREDENELRASLNASVTAGWMTVNEARARAALERDEGGDVFLRSMASLEQPTGAAPRPMLAAPAEPTAAKADADRASRADYRAAQKLSREIEEEKRRTIEEYEGQIAEELALIGRRVAEAVADG